MKTKENGETAVNAAEFDAAYLYLKKLYRLYEERVTTNVAAHELQAVSHIDPSIAKALHELDIVSRDTIGKIIDKISKASRLVN